MLTGVVWVGIETNGELFVNTVMEVLQITSNFLAS